ncbi:MAG: hypothetical protein HZC49_11025 [Nitrospirae bacterium]|nr:hypothetical protein [Nitrospirota bacterium]
MEQKSLFGASAGRLPYIECSPGGQGGPKATECIRERIESYPTWFIRGQRHEGILKPDQLAAFSGYQGTR